MCLKHMHHNGKYKSSRSMNALTYNLGHHFKFLLHIYIRVITGVFFPWSAKDSRKVFVILPSSCYTPAGPGKCNIVADQKD